MFTFRNYIIFMMNIFKATDSNETDDKKKFAFSVAEYFFTYFSVGF